MFSQLMIMDTQEIIRRFQNKVSNNHTFEVYLDEVMFEVVERMTVLKSARQDIAAYVQQLLHEFNSPKDDEDIYRLMEDIKLLHSALMEKALEWGLYQDGMLWYEFHQLLQHDVVLTRVEPF